jgi:hypothetical protein
MYSSDMGHVSRKASRDNNFCGMLVNILFFLSKGGALWSSSGTSRVSLSYVVCQFFYPSETYIHP